MDTSQIRFLPLDLPKFNHKQKVLDEFNPDTEFYFWGEEYITHRDRSIPFHDPMPLKPVHTELVDYVNQHFPFTGIVLMKLIRANRDVKPHVDDNYLDFGGPKADFNTITREFRDHQLDTEPCGYRMIIEGDRTSLYLTDGEPQIIDDKLVYGEVTTSVDTEVPTSTDCFALKSYGSMHGVKKTENDDNRLLLFVVGWLDKEAHNALISQSYVEYSDYTR
jgi:hypothetical protein